MRLWPRHPVIYEINTWVWLQELSREYKKPVTLAKVPREEWDAIGAMKVDAVWFMGVWERSPAGIYIANKNEGLLEDFRRVLPDYRLEDNVGSPYCVRKYAVDERLGGPEGLAIARRELAGRGIRLILDFVPNHVAPDHPWVTRHPEYFIQGNSDDIRNDLVSFIEGGERCLPVVGILIFPPGRTYCNSMPSIQVFAVRYEKLYLILPANAMACAAIWRCCS